MGAPRSGRSDLSEWQRSAEGEEACRRRQMLGTATGPPVPTDQRFQNAKNGFSARVAGIFFLKSPKVKFFCGRRENDMLYRFRWLSTADTRLFRAEWRWKNPGVNADGNLPPACCRFLKKAPLIDTVILPSPFGSEESGVGCRKPSKTI